MSTTSAPALTACGALAGLFQAGAFAQNGQTAGCTVAGLTAHNKTNIGALEGANAAAFAALGFTASAGLAFTLVRRGRQVVWIMIGLLTLVAMRSDAWLTRARLAR